MIPGLPDPSPRQTTWIADVMIISLSAVHYGGPHVQQDEQTRMERRHIFAVNGSPDFLDILR